MALHICRFVQVASPTSANGLQQAGLLSADALLLAAQDMPWNSPAEADAHVLGTLVEIQELLTPPAVGQGLPVVGQGCSGSDLVLQVGAAGSSAKRSSCGAQQDTDQLAGAVKQMSVDLQVVLPETVLVCCSSDASQITGMLELVSMACPSLV
jgi:hypothetical protein